MSEFLRMHYSILEIELIDIGFEAQRLNTRGGLVFNLCVY